MSRVSILRVITGGLKLNVSNSIFVMNVMMGLNPIFK